MLVTSTIGANGQCFVQVHPTWPLWRHVQPKNMQIYLSSVITLYLGNMEAVITSLRFKWQILLVLLVLCCFFRNEQSREQLCVNSSWRQHATKAPTVRSDTRRVRRQWCANTGCVGSARREISVNSFMSTTWPKCQNVTSTPNSVSDRSFFYYPSWCHIIPRNAIPLEYPLPPPLLLGILPSPCVLPWLYTWK